MRLPEQLDHFALVCACFDLCQPVFGQGFIVEKSDWNSAATQQHCDCPQSEQAGKQYPHPVLNGWRITSKVSAANTHNNIDLCIRSIANLFWVKTCSYGKDPDRTAFILVILTRISGQKLHKIPCHWLSPFLGDFIEEYKFLS
jgi:hypothetical protein